MSAPVPNGAYGPVPRKEDARFIRGRGMFVDDLQLPGMLYGAILRSPLPHARITAIDTVAAEAHPRVEAVFTGAHQSVETMIGPSLFSRHSVM